MYLNEQGEDARKREDIIERCIMIEIRYSDLIGERYEKLKGEFWGERP